MTRISLHNTRTRRKEPFAPLDAQNVRMYVCGPTVYDRAHLGNARPVVVFDVLFRLLRHVFGPEHVTYVRNFTDVDDKINARAREMQAGGDGRDLNAIIRTLTDETIGWYHQDMDALGALRPSHEPRATEYIGQMVAMIEDLLAKGCAYAAGGHVLFDVRAYPEYGRLSGRSVDDMIAGARVEVAPYKRDPLDFVLWKPSSEDEPGWDGPVWDGKSVGRGRPGWHIECSAMADDLLWAKPMQDGRLNAQALAQPHVFDIHGGGIDLQFPHHENEIAQSCCAHGHEGGTGGDFARFWLHNEMVQVDGRKMSKSLGNFFTVRDLLDQGWPGEVIRFVMLSTHYRKPMDWTEEKAREARKVLAGWVDRLRNSHLDFSRENWSVYLTHAAYAPDDKVLAALKDDLNTAAAIARLHELARRSDVEAVNALLGSLVQLGLVGPETSLDLLAPSGVGWLVAHDPAVEKRIAVLLFERQEARKQRDFAKADAIRDMLAAAGVSVEDTPDGPEWHATSGFDPEKLEQTG